MEISKGAIGQNIISANDLKLMLADEYLLRRSYEKIIEELQKRIQELERKGP